MAEERKIASTGTIRMGAPAHPLPEEIFEQLRSGLSAIPGLVEAHLPLAWVEDTGREPEFLMVVAFRDQKTLVVGMPLIGGLMRQAFPEPNNLNVIPTMPGAPMVMQARNANCCLVAERPKAWWKFSRFRPTP